MPGFVIHLAVGEQYKKKHFMEIQDEEEFKKGIIAPDMNKQLTEIERDKSRTHYGTWGNYNTNVNIEKFLKDKNVNMKSDFWKGYFLHLLTDFYFYNIDFKKEHEKIIENKDKFYEDYDCLNSKLIEKYKIPKIKFLEKYMNIIDKEPKYLKYNKVVEFIEKISNFNIEEQVNIIKEKGMEGLQ